MDDGVLHSYTDPESIRFLSAIQSGYLQLILFLLIVNWAQKRLCRGLGSGPI